MSDFITSLQKYKFALEKLEDWALDQISGTTSNIVHTEVFKDAEEAKKADEDFSVRASISAKKEVTRIMEGV